MAPYVSQEEFKATLNMTGESYADADISLALTAASGAVDAHCGRSFAKTDTETRVYLPARPSYVPIDDLVEITSVESDGVVWDPDSYTLLPHNAPLENRPYEAIKLPYDSVVNLLVPDEPMDGPGPQSVVKVEGKFGWPAVPDGVKQATVMLASRFLKRAREAPFGVAGIGGDGIAVRVTVTDPDIQMLLAPFVKPLRLS